VKAEGGTNGPQELDRLAARQLADYDAHTPGRMFVDAPSVSVAEAYEIQARVAELRQARGEDTIGYKVGCTSRVIQRQLDVDGPIFGRLFASERQRSGATLRLGDFDHFAIEGELAVRLAADVPRRSWPERGLERVVDRVFPVIELHHFVFRAGAPSSREIIANNGMHAGFVMPEQFSGRVDAVEPLLTIRVDGELVDEIRGRELIDEMERSIRWLAETLPEKSQLRAGDVILTGSLARLIPIGSPGRIVVESHPFGVVEAEVVA
jgi:2-keto-4-pentenoate hydratase